GNDWFATNLTSGPSDLSQVSFYTYYPGEAKESDGVTCWGRSQGMGTTTYAASRGLSAGVWHKVELWMKLNTVGQANAVQRLWLDGAQKAEWTGLVLRTDNILKLNSMTIDAGSVVPQTEHAYVDDIMVLAAMPNGSSGSSGQTPPPSPAPVASVGVSLN